MILEVTLFVKAGVFDVAFGGNAGTAAGSAASNG